MFAYVVSQPYPEYARSQVSHAGPANGYTLGTRLFRNKTRKGIPFLVKGEHFSSLVKVIYVIERI